MGDEVRVDPPSLRTLATQMDDVIDLLSSAQSSVAESEISASAFSPAGVPLAYALLGAIEYAGNDAYEQADQVGSIQIRLRQTADYYEAADEASTVTEVGGG